MGNNNSIWKHITPCTFLLNAYLHSHNPRGGTSGTSHPPGGHPNHHMVDHTHSILRQPLWLWNHHLSRGLHIPTSPNPYQLPMEEHIHRTSHTRKSYAPTYYAYPHHQKHPKYNSTLIHPNNTKSSKSNQWILTDNTQPNTTHHSNPTKHSHTDATKTTIHRLTQPKHPKNIKKQ